MECEPLGQFSNQFFSIMCNILIQVAFDCLLLWSIVDSAQYVSCAVLSPRPLFLPLHYILVSSTLSSNTLLTAALHALILFVFYLLISGLGYPDLVLFHQLNIFSLKNKQQETYTSSKQQERHKKS